MKRLIIITLCFCCAFAASAQKKTSTQSRTNTTVRKQISSKQNGKTPAKSNSTLTLKQVKQTFYEVPFIYLKEDQSGILNQLKGYEWIIKSPHEEKLEFFPQKMKYYHYPSHPNYRVKDYNLYDDKGELKAVLLFFYWHSVYTDRLHAEGLEDEGNRMDLEKDLMITAYKNNAYDVNKATPVAKKQIERELGLSHEDPYGYSQEATDYISQLERENKPKVERILRIDRIDATSFNVQYATAYKQPTIVVTYKFFSDGPYKVRYERSFKGMYKKTIPTNQSTEMTENKSQFNEAVGDENEIIYEEVDTPPSFQNGEQGLKTFLANNIKYPVVAAENGMEGCVDVEFVVWNDGSIRNVKVAKSVDPALDKEAVRLVKAMPKWLPGKKDGKYVNVKYTTPINFRLQ